MTIEKVIVGELYTNCYIISINNKCIVIDPGDEYLKIKKVIKKREIIGTIITHNHFDHIGAIQYFDKIYDKSNLIEGMNVIDYFCFEVIYTPGHTDDSICIYFKDSNIMFVGDFIFKDGIGRTDLGGNDYLMYQSLNKMNHYDKKIKIYPGHGKESILGVELEKLLH